MTNKMRIFWLFSGLLALLVTYIATSKHSTLPPTPTSAPIIRFAVIGDFGDAGSDAKAVASLVKDWQPEFIVTTGDNNYESGALETIDGNIGQYYHEFIVPYTGAYGQPSQLENRFFPVLGNHDWISITCKGFECHGPYFDYFALPGNERYYEFQKGPIHFFMLDSDEHEPDGIDSQSKQAKWLQSQMQVSTAPWQIVVLHHSPYSSATEHGSEPVFQWPYKAWGADVVLSGHDHTYERLLVDDLLYLVNGLGGRSIYELGSSIAGSQVAYNDHYGALMVEGNEAWLTFRFMAVTGALVDSYTLQR